MMRWKTPELSGRRYTCGAWRRRRRLRPRLPAQVQRPRWSLLGGNRRFMMMMTAATRRLRPRLQAQVQRPRWRWGGNKKL